MKREELRLQRLRKVYGNVEAVADISLTVEPGTVLTLLGPSGCGKTTLLRMIAGFAGPTSGRIVLGGADITELPANRRDIGVVFQNYALFPHLNVAENVGFGLKARKQADAEIAQQVERMLALVKLEGYADRYPAQLSGGQQQRAAVARALAIDPRLLLLDEPLSALDKNLRQIVQQELRQLQRRLGVTTIVVTHDQEEAFVLSDKVAVMNAGRILQVGAPQEIYDRPGTRFVAEFLGSGNLIPGKVIGSDASSATIRLSEGSQIAVRSSLPLGSDVDIFVRPEKLHFGGPQSEAPEALRFEATLSEVREVGGRMEIEARLFDGSRVVAYRLRDGGPPFGCAAGARLRGYAALGSFVVLRRDAS